MATARRASMTASVIVCLLGAQFNGVLHASDVDGATLSPDTPIAAAETASTGRPVGELGRLMFDTTRRSADSSFSNAVTAVHGFKPDANPFAVSAEQIYQGPPYPYRSRRRHDGAIAAIMIGAAAAITGTAVLVYANRPECSANVLANGCGYGTKVVGTAVLSGGLVGLFVGAIAWR